MAPLLRILRGAGEAAQRSKLGGEDNVDELLGAGAMVDDGRSVSFQSPPWTTEEDLGEPNHDLLCSSSVVCHFDAPRRR